MDLTSMDNAGENRFDHKQLSWLRLLLEKDREDSALASEQTQSTVLMIRFGHHGNTDRGWYLTFH